MFSKEFLLTSLIVVLIPGTGVIYTVSTGLFVNRYASIAAAIGCTAGIIPHLLASILGLSFVVHMGALAFQTIKIAGAAYLLFLAWSMWRDTGRLELDQPVEKKSALKIATRGLLINILNPKLSVFFLAFLPQFVSTEASSATIQLLGMSGIFMVTTLIIFIIYGLFASSLRTYVINSPSVIKALQRSFAAVFAMLGAKLALSEQ